MLLGKKIAVGNTAEIYQRGNRITKLFFKRFTGKQAENEANKQKFAQSVGLLVPEIYEVTWIKKRQAIVMEYVDGITLGEKMLAEKEQTEACLRKSVETQLLVHSKSGDSIITMAEKLRRQILVAGMEDGLREESLERLKDLPKENYLCHGDFHVANLLETEKGIYVLDWVDASVGSPLLDACRTFLLYYENFREISKPYLKLYCEKSGKKEREILRFAPLVAAARLSEGISFEQAALMQRIAEGKEF